MGLPAFLLPNEKHSGIVSCMASLDIALADEPEVAEDTGKSDAFGPLVKAKGGTLKQLESAAALAAPARMQRQVKVDTIVAIMASGQWIPAKAHELAEVWGVHISTVRECSAEASRLLTYSADRDEVKASLMAGLEALRLRCEASDDPKQQANAIKAYELLTRIHGLEAPRQTELTVKVPTRAEALAELRAAALDDPTVVEALGIEVDEPGHE